MILLLRLIVLDVIFISAGVIQYLIITMLAQPDLFDTYVFVIISNVGLGLTLVAYSLWIILKWKAHYYEIYPSSIVEHEGVFAKRERSYACNRIERVSMEQSMIGRLFGFGSISMYDPFLEKNIRINWISHPQRYQDLLKKAYLGDKTSDRKSQDE